MLTDENKMTLLAMGYRSLGGDIFAKPICGEILLFRDGTISRMFRDFSTGKPMVWSKADLRELTVENIVYVEACLYERFSGKFQTGFAFSTKRDLEAVLEGDT